MTTPDSAAPYNEMYANDDRTFDNPLQSPYLPMFQEVVAEVGRRGIRHVLEVGCGSGTLARMMLGAGVGAYAGFDLATEGVRKAAERTPGLDVWVGDATDPANYRRDYDGIVCVEVLEHIDGDLDAIAAWRPGATVVCSVPNFDYPTHVRHFSHEREVAARYGGLLEIERIVRVRKPILKGLTWSAYFRRLRWSRDDPKRFLGLLGINAFDWHAGWFVFSGRRRPGAG